jgi:phosphoribosylamine--glycine ligase
MKERRFNVECFVLGKWTYFVGPVSREVAEKTRDFMVMGAYSPAPVVTPDVYQRIMDQVIHPTLAGLQAEGIRYRGFLYAGLMINADGQPKVIEYNCRFGDPETQPVLMRLKSDFLHLCQAALHGQLKDYQAQWDERPAVGVVLASRGYPGNYPTGSEVTGLDTPADQDSKVFHAGTRLDAEGRVLTTGGRVFCATALGHSVAEARERAYQLADQVHWDARMMRRDIGYRAIIREQAINGS